MRHRYEEGELHQVSEGDMEKNLGHVIDKLYQENKVEITRW